MNRHSGLLRIILLLAAVAALGPAPSAWAAAAKFEETRIFIEYNSSAGDLGFQVSLDAEEWKTMKIINPAGVTICEITGKGAYGALGLSELFFEGAEPNLADFPLDKLLALFPEGKYRFSGVTVEGTRLEGSWMLTHAVPAGPAVSSEVDGDTIIIRWDPVTGPPAGFPQERIDIVGYQILVGANDEFQMTLPASSTQVTLPPEFVRSLQRGSHGFEVLAIDASGNQTITEGSFETP